MQWIKLEEDEFFFKKGIQLFIHKHLLGGPGLLKQSCWHLAE